MSEDLIKKSCENEQQYLWRVDNLIRSGKYKNWEEVTPFVNSQLFDDEMDYRGESAFRKKVAAARQFYEANVFKSYDDDEYINELKRQKHEIEIEKMKLHDERTNYNRDSRILARVDSCFQDLMDLVSKTSPYTYKSCKIFTDNDRDLLVCLSDIHMGLETHNLFGNYSPSIAKEYMDRYLEKIKKIQSEQSLDDCYLALLGDQVNGRIHLTTMIENRDDVIEQIQQVSELVSWFISELSKIFNRVFVNSVSGNHSRLDKKEAALRTERLDRIVCWYAKARLCNFSNVIFCDTCKYDPTIAYFNIRGNHFLLCHGDYDPRSAAGVQKLTMMIGEPPYAIVMGHRHANAFEEISGVNIIQSGSFAGSGSDYCIEKRITGEPSQAVAIVSESGIEAFYPVILNR